MTTTSNREHCDDVLAGSFILDPNDELITITPEMFADPDETP